MKNKFLATQLIYNNANTFKKYLGNYVNKDENLEDEIAHRIRNAYSAYGNLS